MHKNFGEWYRLVSIEPDGAKLQKRWAGVRAWSTSLRNDDNSVLETVRIFHGFAPKTSRDPFLTAFRKQDPAFPQRNDLELQVLAGAALVECVQSVGDDGTGLRTAVVAGTALEASILRTSEPRLDEITREVLTGLHDIAIEQRKRKPFDLSAISDKADVAAQAMKHIAAAGDWDQLKTAIIPVLQSLLDSARAAEVQLSYAAHNVRRADEETNILWWLKGGCSRDTNKAWAALKDGAAVIAGTELADLTDVALGMRDASALLEQVLSEANGEAKDAPLRAYVNALPEDWARGRSAKTEDHALDLTPLTLAISQRGKSDTASWQQYFDSSSGMRSSTLLAAVRVARQAYVEAMLLHALTDVDTEE
jgi:hypothetical protein